jgi:replicative DNA helicase
MAELTTPEHLRATHAERAVLGCIFTDESSVDLISATLELSSDPLCL